MEQKDPNAKEGMRVRLVAMMDDPNPVTPGTEGTIRLVDGMGVIHVKWDDGRTLGLIPGVDHYQLSPNSNTDLYDETNQMFESSSGGSEIKAAIKKTPSVVNKSMPKPTKISSSANSAMKSTGIKTGQVKKNFKSAGIKDIKVESNEIKGGKADKLSIKDLAKKHNVSIEDIKKEIKIGVKIEREHVGNDLDKAKEISMDHISEFADYYSNKRYGVLASEKGLKKSEKKKKEEVDYMSAGGGTTTTSVGGVNGMGYTSPAAWGAGVLTKKTGVAKPGPVKEHTATFYSTTTGDVKYKQYDDNHLGKDSWADTNSDGWRFNDDAFYEEGVIVDPLAKINATWDDEKLDISNEWESAQNKKITEVTSLSSALGDHSPVDPLGFEYDNEENKFNDDDHLNYDRKNKGASGIKLGKTTKSSKKTSKKSLKKEDFLRMVSEGKKKYEIVNDKELDSVKDNFKPPIEEEELDETTTFNSVWGSNGPPVGPAFAAKKGDWKMIKRPIWKGGTIVQQDLNSGIMNPINEVKIKDVNSLQVGHKYKLLIPNYDEGGTEETKVEVIKKDKTGYVFKDLDNDITFHRSFQHLKNEEILSEVNSVKYNPNGKYVKIKKKCTKFPYCNQGAIDNPLEITNSTDSGNYIAESMKNIHEIAKKTGKSFDEVYKIVKEQMKLR